MKEEEEEEEEEDDLHINFMERRRTDQLLSLYLSLPLSLSTPRYVCSVAPSLEGKAYLQGCAGSRRYLGGGSLRFKVCLLLKIIF